MKAITRFILLFTAQSLMAAPSLDPVPSAGQKPYSPADGQIVEINPPPFIWIPYARKAEYALQLSRTKAFESPTTFRDFSLNVFVPGQPLDPGDWFWRYGVKTKDGMNWGRARPFTIPETARPFPFPDMKKALAKVPQKHPRLFFSGERLERVRAWGEGELKSRIKDLKRRCDRIIGETIVAEPAKPKNGPEKVTVMRTTRPPMDDMERCALVYLVTQDRRYGEEAKRRVLHFFDWNPNGSTGLWGYDEPAMWMMMRGIRAYDWTYDLFSEEERARIEPAMKERARQFFVHLKDKRRFHTNPYESHAGRMPGFLGEAVLCFAHEWPEAEQWITYATLLYYTSYPGWGGDDGGWQEGPHYWSAYMKFALHYVVALREATGIDLMQKPFFRNTPMYALYTAPPYHQFAPFGDNQQHSPRGLESVMYTFSTLTQNPYVRSYADIAGFKPGGDVLSLAMYDPALKAKPPTALPGARVFPAVGLAAFHTELGDRNRDISLVFRSSPFGSVSHGHADQNAFVLEAFGKGMAIPTGFYPWYGSPHHHNWTRATRAVNSVLVNGEGQERRSWEAKGRITAFESTDLADYVEGEAAEAYGKKLERFRRRILHIKPGVFVMLDDLIAREPCTFQWLLHSVNKMAIGQRTVIARNDPGKMNVHILAPEHFDITQNDRYDPEPEVSPKRKPNYPKTWHLTVTPEGKSRRVRFLTVFDVHQADEMDRVLTADILEFEERVRIALTSRDGRKREVLFEPHEETGCRWELK